MTTENDAPPPDELSNTLDTITLLNKVATSLQSEFSVYSTIPHRGEAGRALEESLREALTRHLPSRFGFRTGIALGSDRQASRQVDLIIVDEPNCPAFLRTPGSGIYPIDGTVAAIEVTNFLDKGKWRDDCQKLVQFRKLKPAARGHSPTPPSGFIFAASASAKIETVAGWVAEHFATITRDESRYLPNGIIILDAGIICFMEETGDERRISSNPQRATSVVAINSEKIHLGLMLQLMTHEFEQVIQERTKAHLLDLLAQDIKTSPLKFSQMPPGSGHWVDIIANSINYLSAGMAKSANFHDYLGVDNLIQSIEAGLHVVKIHQG